MFGGDLYHEHSHGKSLRHEHSHGKGLHHEGSPTRDLYRQLDGPVKSFFDRQHLDAYRLIDTVRDPDTGLYSDAYDTFQKAPVPMGSIAATGVGLSALAIAHVEGWDPSAGPKAVQTLRNVLAGAAPRDERTGFFYHFHDLKTEAVWGNSEISTIDTAILVAGARIASHYLGDEFPETSVAARKLMDTIDWKVALGDPEQGIIYMVIEDGKGTVPGRPFNEYAIVISVANDAAPDDPVISDFWHRVYAPGQVKNLPTRLYHGARLLVDTPEGGTFLSSFVCQFPLYLVTDYATCSDYQELVAGACLADRISWKVAGKTPSYIWGHGAGANHGLPIGKSAGLAGAPADAQHAQGYRVDAIDRSSGVASAYIIAGFLPVYPHGIYDLYAWYRLHLPYDTYAAHDFPEAESDNPPPAHLLDEHNLSKAYRFGLNRFSWFHRRPPNRWYPRQVTVIDWSTMLWGMTAFKHGLQFFALEADSPNSEEVVG